jgi:DNA-3-methyladenine glycosylase II
MKKETNALIGLDSRFQRLVDEFGYPNYQKEKDYFEALVRNIVYQQLSGKAASTIFSRFLNLFDSNQFPQPADIISVNKDTLRSVGLSNQKVSYILDLCEKCINNDLDFTSIDKLDDQEVSQKLVQVKGIGQWTADMFLMFTLNRLDVFPLGDLGVKKGVQIFEKLQDLPREKEMATVSLQWQPYRTLAAWYMWKLVDGPFEW